MDQQHLRIKFFFGTSENAVKTQLWIAVSVYLLVAIVQKAITDEIHAVSFNQLILFN